jgi:predicted acetyltransferase
MIDFALCSSYFLNLTTLIVLFCGIYYKNYKQSELFFTFFVFNSVIFFVAFFLNKVAISTGAGFGLFAVFSILRYRTEGIGTKDMTYLFLSIAIGLITALTTDSNPETIAFCIVMLLVTLAFESDILIKREASKIIFYDNIDLIHADKEADLLTDLKSRTALSIHRFTINSIDFLKDSCVITIYYYEK